MALRLFLFCLVLCGVLPASGQQRRFRLPAELREASGLYVAGPDSLWWLNDGGHGPFLWLTDGGGQLRSKVPVPGARNLDWEDLTADDRGRLYLGDFGNNLNRREDLRIYRFDPAGGRLDSILFRYPDQHDFPPAAAHANFDLEAFFWYQDSLHLFSKNRLRQGNDYTKHYVLPARPGVYVAGLRDSIYLKNRVVTGAAISPDGQTIALLTYWFKPFLGFIPLSQTSLFILEDFPSDDFLAGTLKKQKVPHFLKPRQFEAVDFLHPHEVLIGSERTILFRQLARKITLKSARRTQQQAQRAEAETSPASRG